MFHFVYIIVKQNLFARPLSPCQTNEQQAPDKVVDICVGGNIKWQ